MSYCKAILTMPPDSPHIAYHDKEYGFPLYDDNELFGRLILEINQAGLSWTTILNKADNFRRAYSDFKIEEVANYSEHDRSRLLSDAGIIRNKLKVNAAIHNAQKIMELQESHGSFKNWLDTQHPLQKDDWVRLFKKMGFKFVGGEIINEFMMSTGYLEGAHEVSCPVYKEVLELNPAWYQG